MQNRFAGQKKININSNFKNYETIRKLWCSSVEHVPNLEGLESFTTFLLGRFNLKGVLVTLGEHGALANFDSHIYKVNGVKVKVKDTVGSGDSFLAAFISKYIEGLDIEECLLFGCATGAFIATCSGANPEYEVSDIYKLLEQNKW